MLDLALRNLAVGNGEFGNGELGLRTIQPSAWREAKETRSWMAEISGEGLRPPHLYLRVTTLPVNIDSVATPVGHLLITGHCYVGRA